MGCNKSSNKCIASSPSRRRQEQYLRINVKKFPVDERYQAIVLGDAANSRWGIEKKTTPTYITVKKLKTKDRENHKKDPKRRVHCFSRNNHVIEN